jgi:hypothetical protein
MSISLPAVDRQVDGGICDQFATIGAVDLIDVLGSTSGSMLPTGRA